MNADLKHVLVRKKREGREKFLSFSFLRSLRFSRTIILDCCLSKTLDACLRRHDEIIPDNSAPAQE
jgi:hypothetical protein